jgi:hypothetical protein
LIKRGHIPDYPVGVGIRGEGGAAPTRDFRQ